MLGALANAGQLPVEVPSGLDFVMVRSADLHGVVPVMQLVPAVRASRLPALLLVASADQVIAAVAAGADGILAEAEAGLAEMDGVDAVLSEGGRARLVTSVEAARAAFATGADLVIYDLPAIVAGVLATLEDGRPIGEAEIGRQPLVLLSGMLGDASLWDRFAARVDDLVLPWPARIDLDDSVQEMAATVLAEAPSRFALAGHSLGAIVAMEIVRQQPERVRSLALVNASARGPVDVQLAAWASWRQRVTEGEFDRIASELAVATLAPSRRADPPIVEANRRMADTVGADGFLRQLSAQMTRPDSSVSVGAITVPVLVVSGEFDEICEPALQRELAEHCSNAEFVSIAGGGHMLPLESPDALAEQFRTWLTKR
jgi:pimeloyl-ACP methyl ester carboxylesterase